MPQHANERPALTLEKSPRVVALVIAIVLPLGYFALAFGITHSLRGVLSGTGLMALLGLLMGGMTYTTLRIGLLPAMRRATDALGQQQEYWKFALEGGGNGVWDRNVQTGEILHSKRYFEMFGYTEDEAASLLQDWESRVHPDDLPSVKASQQAYLDGKTTLYTNERRMRCKDGSWKWVLMRGMLVSRDAAGKPLRIIGTHTDITERKQAAAAVQESEERFRAAFEQAGVGMGLRALDLDLSNPPWLRVNQKLCEILGYTREELLQISSLDFTPPEDRQSAVDYNGKLLRGEIRNYSRVKRYVRKDGRIIWADLSVSAVSGTDGRPSQVISAVRDITESKGAEEARAQLAAIVDSSTEAIVSLGLDRKILSWNASAERLFGYAAAEIIGRDIALFIPLDRAEETAHDRALLAQGHAVTDHESVRLAKGGRRIQVSLSQSPIIDEHGAIVGMSLIFRDISERKQAQQARANLAAIVENSNDAIISHAFSGNIMSWNAAAARMLGYTAAEMIGQSSDLIHPPGWTSRIARNIERVRRGKMVPPHESHRVTKDGRVIDVLTSHSPIRDHDGNIVGTSVILHDMSVLKQAAAAVQESEERFRAAFEQAGVGMGLRALDLDLSNPPWLRVNQKLCDILGYTREELLQLASVDITPPEDRQVSIDNLERLRRGEISSFAREKRYVRKDGRIIWTNISVSTVSGPDGRPRHIISVIQDITESRRAEETRAQLAAIVESSNDAIISRSLDRAIVSWNSAAERLFGYTAAEAIGQSASIIIPPDREHEAARNRALLGQGHAVVIRETVRLAKGGRRIDVSLSQSPIRDASGAPAGASLIFSDISERKRAEAQILKLNAELEQRVRERTRQLEATNKELEAFSYSVSHDLRAPLRGIDGFSQILLEKHAGQLDETGSNYLQRIRNAGKRMGELIDDLLQLSKVSRAKVTIEAVDLSQLARLILRELGDRAPQRRVATDVQDGVRISGDPRLLRIALENLLGNAWKFTGKREEARIRFGARKHDGEQAVFVEDNGAGFDIKYGHKLFGAFQRLHGETEFEGTGIGLATVQRVINLHGGRIWADSTLGKGATFYFTLPHCVPDAITIPQKGQAA